MSMTHVVFCGPTWPVSTVTAACGAVATVRIETLCGRSFLNIQTLAGRFRHRHECFRGDFYKRCFERALAIPERKRHVHG